MSEFATNVLAQVKAGPCHPASCRAPAHRWNTAFVVTAPAPPIWVAQPRLWADKCFFHLRGLWLTDANYCNKNSLDTATQFWSQGVCWRSSIQRIALGKAWRFVQAWNCQLFCIAWRWNLVGSNWRWQLEPIEQVLVGQSHFHEYKLENCFQDTWTAMTWSLKMKDLPCTGQLCRQTVRPIDGKKR